MNDTSMPRVARLAEPEVARVGVVVVVALAQEREAEDVAVEGRRAVEVGADAGDVVQAGQPHPPGVRLVGRARAGVLGARAGPGMLGAAHTRNPIPPVRA